MKIREVVSVLIWGAVGIMGWSGAFALLFISLRGHELPTIGTFVTMLLCAFIGFSATAQVDGPRNRQ
jgi:Na+/H+ antiporter NhaC